MGTSGSVAANTLILRGSNAVTLSGTTLNSSAALSHDGGNGTLLLDSTSVTAGTVASANSASINVLTSSVNGNTLSLTSSGTTSIGAGGPALLNATDSATLTAGTLLVAGGSSTGGSAKILAANTVTVNAGDAVTLTAGTGADSDAVIESSLGNVLINAGGAVTLTAGAGADADAVIAANFGAGTVDVTSDPLCDTCVTLNVNPFANATSDQGVYAAVVNLMSPSATIVPGTAGGSVQGDALDISVRDVLVLEDLVATLVSEGSSSDDNDEDENDQKICR